MKMRKHLISFAVVGGTAAAIGLVVRHARQKEREKYLDGLLFWTEAAKKTIRQTSTGDHPALREQLITELIEMGAGYPWAKTWVDSHTPKVR